eukprot:s1672_g9.t1
MSARAAREGRRLGDASESCVPTISAQSSASSASTPRQTVLATAAIPGYTGHIPNKDIEVCGGTFTVESMAAAAIRTRRQRCRTSVFSKQLADGRTYAQGFSEQLGLENYQPWTQPAAGVTHSFERYSRAARPICFVRRDNWDTIPCNFDLGLHYAEGSALLTEGRHLHVYAGAGIVPGSNPTEEWDEISLKMRQFTEAFPDSSVPSGAGLVDALMALPNSGRERRFFFIRYLHCYIDDC